MSQYTYQTVSGTEAITITNSEEDDDDFRIVVQKTIRAEQNKELKRQGLYYGKEGRYGNWYIWQRNQIEDFRQLPKSRYERFNMFIAESAPKLQAGKQHLHAFYDKKTSNAYWKLTGPSRVCKIPGRCQKILLMMDVDG